MTDRPPEWRTAQGEAAARQAARARLHPDDPQRRERVIDRHAGCLLGGAVGDALGAPVEFMSLERIRRQFGPQGIRRYAPAWGRLGAITDDTQMTLFTAEGLMRAWVRRQMRGIGPVFASVTDYAYARWMRTQHDRAGFVARPDDVSPDGWLIGHRELFSQRAPGLTCLGALREKRRAGEAARNDSKGCGGVMRAAPVGMLAAALQPGNDTGDRDRITFELGCEIAGLTHGHALGRLPAGCLAVLVAALLDEAPWAEAHERALRQLPADGADAHLLRELLHRAVDLAQTQPLQADCVAALGQGWVAEEALAVAVYCAASVLHEPMAPAEAFDMAVTVAVNHGGDSDSTGAIAGNLVGAALGRQAIAAHWLEPLELREVIEAMAGDLATLGGWEVGDDYESTESDYWWERYPTRTTPNPFADTSQHNPLIFSYTDPQRNKYDHATLCR